MGDDTAVRYRNAVLYDDQFVKHVGDFLLHKDGTWSNSIGDEDVSRRSMDPIESLLGPYRTGILI